MPIFVIEVSDEFQALVLEDATLWSAVSSCLNRKRFGKKWQPAKFVFEDSGNPAKLRPEMTTIYIPGAIAFRADIRTNVFPTSCNEIELLPISVDGTNWLLVNCLKATTQYDSARSVFIRGANGEAFLIQKLIATDPSLDAVGLFSVADSNRGQVFATPSLADRIRQADVKGICLREIGEICRLD